MATNAAYRRRIAAAKSRLDARLAELAKGGGYRTADEFRELVRVRLNVPITPDYAAELIRLNGQVGP